MKSRKGVVANEFPLTLKSKYFIRELNFERHSFNYSASIRKWGVIPRAMLRYFGDRER